MEEPELREHQRECKQRGSGNADRRRDERNDRQQPHEVLRGDELRKGQEGDHGGRAGRDEALVVNRPASDEPDDEEHRRNLENAGCDCESVG